MTAPAFINNNSNSNNNSSNNNSSNNISSNNNNNNNNNAPPPYTQSEDTPLLSPTAAQTSALCIASSRVGAMTRTRGPRARLPVSLALSTWRTAGRRKASVLPEPVAAIPITSRPARRGGPGQHGREMAGID